MEELIRVSTDKEGKRVVSARELYDYLEISERFSKWFDRMSSYGFEDGTDYTPYQMVHPSNNQPSVDFALTMDTAKEIAMIQRTEKGKQARQYFIACEKKLVAFSEREQKRRAKLAKQGKDPAFIEQRIKSVSTRNGFTSVLARHGVAKNGYRNCTNAIYTPLYGGTTEVVRQKKGLERKQNIRDNLPPIELTAVQLAEQLAADNIATNHLTGNAQCELACTSASKAVANAIVQGKKRISG